MTTLPRLPILCTTLATLAISGPTMAETKVGEKHHEDPTKIITRVGLGYDGDVVLSGSVGLDDTRQLRGKITADGDDWSLGGSWLFDSGILNAYVSGNEYKTSYNLGTYVGLSYFGVDTGKWMVFPMGGVSVINPKGEGDVGYGGYLGGFAIRPVDERFSVVTYLGATAASESYFGFWTGIGASYLIKENHSLKTMVNYINDDYESDTTASIAYTIEF